MNKPNLRKSFIGCISDKEAEEMKKKIKDWEQRFNNDFNERHKKLFPLT